jgi:hypothetical protein
MNAEEMKLCRKLREDPWALASLRFAPQVQNSPRKAATCSFLYRYGGHVLGLSIFAAALLLCGY